MNLFLNEKDNGQSFLSKTGVKSSSKFQKEKEVNACLDHGDTLYERILPNSLIDPV